MTDFVVADVDPWRIAPSAHNGRRKAPRREVDGKLLAYGTRRLATKG